MHISIVSVRANNAVPDRTPAGLLYPSRHRSPTSAEGHSPLASFVASYVSLPTRTARMVSDSACHTRVAEGVGVAVIVREAVCVAVAVLLVVRSAVIDEVAVAV